ncbi:MAG: hypothetical protein U0R77_03645 [Mycolicibacterium insubricum]|nr:hypothetical protein [Mycobacterium sp.]
MSLTIELLSSVHSFGTGLGPDQTVDYLARGGRGGGGRGGFRFFFGPVGFLVIAMLIGVAWRVIKFLMGKPTNTTQGYPPAQGYPNAQGFQGYQNSQGYPPAQGFQGYPNVQNPAPPVPQQVPTAGYPTQ